MYEPEQLAILTEHFTQYISDHKKDFIEKVLAVRTRALTVVMEDIYQSQNASAVVRTCECMGIQDIHFIENKSKYSINPKVLKGANKWINLIKHNTRGANNTELCFQSLRSAGYRILVTDPAPGGISLHDLKLDSKVAVIMGNELNGSSEYAIAHADDKLQIPMFGFTESMNISVSAAICVNTLITQLRQSELDWRLSETEKNELRYNWYKKIVRRSELIEKEFFVRQGTQNRS